MSGAGAGRLGTPWGIAANPNLPGHVYVVDEINERIDEFTAWGEFVRAWGWGVDGGIGFEVCTTASGCEQGDPGGGAGQFKQPEAITVDSSGNVYVMEAGNHRVQKFSSEGAFILTFGLDVNKTKEEGGGTQAERNVCTAASGDVCQAGKSGSGLGQFELGFPIYTNVLTTSPVTGTVFVGEGTKRIQAFNPNGSFKEEIKGGCLEGKFVHALTSDAAGDLYVSFLGGTEVRKLKPTGPVADCLPEPKFAVEQVFALAVGPDGHLFANIEEGGVEPSRILEFDASGACLNCGEDGEGGKPGFDRSPETEIKGLAVGDACGPTDVYATHFKASANQSFFHIFGEPPNINDCPQPERPPVIASQYTLSAETGQAIVQAQINPNFFPDTRYYVEYGTSSCAAGGCPNQAPLAPGSILTTKTTKSLVKTAAVVLEGLSPATTYHYRFVAESGGGGPVFGTGAEPTELAGGEATFRTFASPEIEGCPINEAFRTRASALLPDCRAYELVSPLDKASGDVLALREFSTELPATLDQSSTNGNKLAYGSYRSFGDAVSAPFTTQYIAARGANGWASHAISPPRERLAIFVTQHVDTELKALSPDLCESWWRTLAEPEPPMDPLAVPHYPNLYHRQDSECGGTAWEAITTVEPPNLPALRYESLELQGRTADGSAAIYIAEDSLVGSGAPPQAPTCNPEPAPTCALKLYHRSAGETVPKYVCFLPNGSAHTGGCAAGTYGGDLGKARMSNLQGAISEDGSRVFWSAASGPSAAGPARIYMRENPGADETGANDGEGNCVPDPELACTIAVSKAGEALSGTTSSRFWAADSNGERAIFTTGVDSASDINGDLYSFEVDTRATTLIAGDVLGVVGASADAKRVYFVSEEACGGAGQAGKRNLYLYEEGDECAAGEMAFVAELAVPDIVPLPVKPASSAVAPQPRFHSTRVSPDGLTAAFMSSGQPTGYDNTDRISGKPNAEVYRYDASANGGAGELLCVSCNPSGARPLGRDINNADVWVAAQLPVWQNNLYASRALSDDGQRLYFESTDALNLRDTNGITDVYQWEALGSGGCDEEKPSFSPSNGGCVNLISSGQSAQAARFHDASPDGSNVFFSTLESLLGQDYGLIDIYVARTNGGFPEPPPPAPECEGENCQHPAAPPPYTTPPSALYDGPGNLQEKPRKKHCPKGKVKKKGKCVKKGKKGKGKAKRHSQAKHGGSSR